MMTLLPSTPAPYTGKAPESAYETLRTVVLVVLAAFLIRSFIAQPFVVQGRSMEPSLHENEYLVVDKVRYRVGQPQRGDIVVFRSPENLRENYIKRIIGLSGETIRIEQDTVLVNGQPLDENYTQVGTSFSPSGSGNFVLELTLGLDEYFVLGDNRDHSSDSRFWGPLSASNIVGAAVIGVFPLGEFGLIDRPTYQ